MKTAKERAEFRKQPMWQLFRRYLLQSKNNICEFCGKQYKEISSMNIHHRYETNYDNLDVNRFLVLCKTCHEFVHAKYNSPTFAHLKLYGLKDDPSEGKVVPCNR